LGDTNAAEAAKREYRWIGLVKKEKANAWNCTHRDFDLGTLGSATALVA
jgi:hypothetical protein